jgi:hypothetical protein
MPLIKNVEHEFQRMDDVLDIVESIIEDFPVLQEAEMVISELMLNAIEHGNLNISFEEKSELLESGAIIDEIEARLKDPAYSQRKARIEVKAFEDETLVMVFDDGDGFDWKTYLDKKLIEISGLHGRGVLFAELQCKTLAYVGNGNKVIAVFDHGTVESS